VPPTTFRKARSCSSTAMPAESPSRRGEPHHEDHRLARRDRHPARRRPLHDRLAQPVGVEPGAVLRADRPHRGGRPRDRIGTPPSHSPRVPRAEPADPWLPMHSVGTTTVAGPLRVAAARPAPNVFITFSSGGVILGRRLGRRSRRAKSSSPVGGKLARQLSGISYPSGDCCSTTSRSWPRRYRAPTTIRSAGSCAAPASVTWARLGESPSASSASASRGRGAPPAKRRSPPTKKSTLDRRISSCRPTPRAARRTRPSPRWCRRSFSPAASKSSRTTPGRSSGSATVATVPCWFRRWTTRTASSSGLPRGLGHRPRQARSGRARSDPLTTLTDS
jgi:hypothetical protein